MPDDSERVAQLVDLYNAAQVIDDPTSPPALEQLTSRDLRYGWDLEPAKSYFYTPDGADGPVGVMNLGVSERDNLQLVWVGITIHPDHRRQGHGTAIMNQALRRTSEMGRSIVWVGTAADDGGAKAFVEKSGFAYASHEARRRQQLCDVDSHAVDQLFAHAQQAAADYELVRMSPPIPDEILLELIDVTEAINDAPMGDLTYEDSKFDLQRLQDLETARVGRGDEMYRVFARHRQSGEIGGHTFVLTNPLRPTIGVQADTAVSRAHRGHRLGLLVKVDMMHWLADVEPGLEYIETWNHADNTFMISVNESIGYRLDRVYNIYERKLSRTTRNPPEPKMCTPRL